MPSHGEREAMINGPERGRERPVGAPGLQDESPSSSVGRVPSHGVRPNAENEALFETGEELLVRILTERRQNWQGRGKY